MEKSNQRFNSKQRIIHRLLLNAPFIPSVGLLTGQMGIALAFYAYYRHTDCTAYEDFADEKDIRDSFRSLAEVYMGFMEKQKTIWYPFDLSSFIIIDLFDTDKITVYPLGIKDGLAGLLLKEIVND